jgi:hypothetical protein
MPTSQISQEEAAQAGARAPTPRIPPFDCFWNACSTNTRPANLTPRALPVRSAMLPSPTPCVVVPSPQRHEDEQDP